MQIGIIVESAEPREVMHFALLLGYGASVINPYLAFAAIDHLVKEGEINLDYSEARKNYIKAIDKGLLKILSKMGISTLKSYHGSQLFEAVGISDELIDNYFTGTSSRIGGIGYEEIFREALMFHNEAYKKQSDNFIFSSFGDYRYRNMGNFMPGILKALPYCSGLQKPITTKFIRNSAIWSISKMQSPLLSGGL